MIYETAPISSTSITPHLWIYRPQITVNHMILALEKDAPIGDLKVLRKFLHSVSTILFNLNIIISLSVRLMY